MTTRSGFKRALFDVVMMAVVSGLSLLLLIYVGLGEATRVYQQFQVEKLFAQTRVIQSAMEQFLRPGLAMKNFIGFNSLSERIIDSDPSIVAIAVFDRAGRAIFTTGDPRIGLLKNNPLTDIESKVANDVRSDGRHTQVVLPLHDRFEIVGLLAISVPHVLAVARVERQFKPLMIAAAAAAVAFGLFVGVGGTRLTGTRRRWLAIAYAATFLGMSVSVVVALVSLYSEGAQAKTSALANSLGQRLNSIFQSGLNITEIQGLDKVFVEYQQLNPDISAAGLIVDKLIAIHTDARQVGRAWTSDPTTYEYQVDLTRPAGRDITTRPGGRDIRLFVALPVDVIYRQIGRSVKNFTALFVASAFMALLFLQLAGSVRRSQDLPKPKSSEMEEHELELDIIKPVFFVGVFVEHLTYPFLSQFLQELVHVSRISPIGTSALFMSYYLFFAASLIPAGHLAQRRSPRSLMYGGLVLSALGLAMLAFDPNFITAFCARAISGIGQGILFIAVQSYILNATTSERRTQGASIIVFGFQGGMISGMAIGSLLVGQLGTPGVFVLAATIAIAMSLYVRVMVPDIRRIVASTEERLSEAGVVWRDLLRVISSADFIRTMLMIGIPAKAVLTGVIIFAMPLLMTRMGYAQEDIGQILMVYAAGVLVASSVISRLVDRSGKTDGVLFAGALASGVGLIIISMTGWPTAHYGATALLVIGTAVVGIAHGFINAPVITHIANSHLATAIGPPSATATYRLLERLGHIGGPLIVGQLFVSSGPEPEIIGLLGAGIIVFGLIFILHIPAPKEAVS